MDLRLTHQTAIVVGGAKGIGLAIARAFADSGAHVAIADRDPLVVLAAQELATADLHAVGVTVDVTNGCAVDEFAQRVLADFPGPFHLIYAAGAGSGKFGFPFWNLSPEDWPRMLDINLIGAVRSAHAFAPTMATARQGTITFISSVAGQIGSQTDPPYSAAKAALINFAQCAAKDLAPHDVRVNTICPGMVKTSVNRSVWQAWWNLQPHDKRLDYDTWASEKIERLTPLRRWQDPCDIATMAVFLASPLAKNVTGQAINVDGGWVMHA